jgi:hypothetical protein
MDWKSFFVEIINTLVWPIVLLIFICFFKEQIRSLIKSLTKLTIGNASAVFDKEKLAEKISIKNAGKEADSEKQFFVSKEDILSIPDNDYEFMQEIAGNVDFMPTDKSEGFKYNSLINHGYFEKDQENVYKPTKKGAEILAALKSIYYS